MAKSSVDRKDDGDGLRSSVLGRRRRFSFSGHQSEHGEDSRSRSRSEFPERYGDEYSDGRSWSPPCGRTVGSLQFTLTDPDVLNCAVCVEPLTIPVFQCVNGHIACSSCCKKIGNKCPSCFMAIGYKRCHAIEKVLQSVQMACQNVKLGCNQKFGYHMKNVHEKKCPFAPCSCPFSSCNYIGSFRMLVNHFSTKHGASPTSFRFSFSTSLLMNVETEVYLLKEEREDVLFVLKNETVDLGSKIKISCIGPLPNAAYSYDIVANSQESYLKLHTCSKSVPDSGYNPNLEPYLLVPRGFFNDLLGLKFEVCIWRSEARD
ncbi:hypothetical protein BT93_L4965 [Corymbia citriodora subsp. variegata]|uniref:RING-type E3 ubiquitin transferase n=1 Tax=Corymbia citriodora subsp. variegata TaxID=360336 RepID=A0A8T0CT64_CORYI|nr:hypothetical protein BT93_L4965 [Corymbia citriodora subsp. variegata]